MRKVQNKGSTHEHSERVQCIIILFVKLLTVHGSI
jgi:hypothetical protein